MKKLRIFGMLVTVMLLAFGFGLLGCSSDDGDDPVDPVPNGPVLTGEYLRFTGTDSQDRDVEVIFREVAARYTPKSGDRYEIRVSGSVTSSGRVVISQQNVEFIPEPNGERFYGIINGDNFLTISAGGPVPGFTSQRTTPSVINPGSRITYTVAQSGGASGTTTTSSLVFTFDRPFNNLSEEDISISFGGLARDGVAVKRGYRFNPDPNSTEFNTVVMLANPGGATVVNNIKQLRPQDLSIVRDANVDISLVPSNENRTWTLALNLDRFDPLRFNHNNVPALPIPVDGLNSTALNGQLSHLAAGWITVSIDNSWIECSSPEVFVFSGTGTGGGGSDRLGFVDADSVPRPLTNVELASGLAWTAPNNTTNSARQPFVYQTTKAIQFRVDRTVATTGAAFLNNRLESNLNHFKFDPPGAATVTAVVEDGFDPAVYTVSITPNQAGPVVFWIDHPGFNPMARTTLTLQRWGGPINYTVRAIPGTGPAHATQGGGGTTVFLEFVFDRAIDQLVRTDGGVNFDDDIALGRANSRGWLIKGSSNAVDPTNITIVDRNPFGWAEQGVGGRNHSTGVVLRGGGPGQGQAVVASDGPALAAPPFAVGGSGSDSVGDANRPWRRINGTTWRLQLDNENATYLQQVQTGPVSVAIADVRFDLGEGAPNPVVPTIMINPNPVTVNVTRAIEIGRGTGAPNFQNFNDVNIANRLGLGADSYANGAHHIVLGRYDPQNRQHEWMEIEFNGKVDNLLNSQIEVRTGSGRGVQSTSERGGGTVQYVNTRTFTPGTPYKVAYNPARPNNSVWRIPIHDIRDANPAGAAWDGLERVQIRINRAGHLYSGTGNENPVPAAGGRGWTPDIEIRDNSNRQ